MLIMTIRGRLVAAGFWRCLRGQLFRSWASGLRRLWSLDWVPHVT